MVKPQFRKQLVYMSVAQGRAIGVLHGETSSPQICNFDTVRTVIANNASLFVCCLTYVTRGIS